jgi:hypothetical protein
MCMDLEIFCLYLFAEEPIRCSILCNLVSLHRVNCGELTCNICFLLLMMFA